ncbi:Uncharacterized protein APZ42_021021 [Daphnia magna]|uniref:Uncharacterized protein n=1 Tax=Daphnia magna TaxID=35525 RepID=A0A164WWS1_9CRUS|nr:Uncharacterized protein APZ42_021021 [Daphnia magna]
MVTLLSKENCTNMLTPSINYNSQESDWLETHCGDRNTQGSKNFSFHD